MNQDSLDSEKTQAEQFTNVSKSKPIQFQHHLHKAIIKKNQLPSYFIYFPTSRCNLSCSHCFYHDSLNKRFNELTLAEIDSLCVLEPK